VNHKKGKEQRKSSNGELQELLSVTGNKLQWRIILQR